jgi:hypothetical protein
MSLHHVVLGCCLSVVALGPAGCKKKSSDPAAAGSGSAVASRTRSDSSAGSAAAATADAAPATGSGSAGSAAPAPMVDEAALIAKIASVTADQLIDDSGTADIPVKGSIEDYVRAVAGPNGKPAVTVVIFRGGGACVRITGEPCPDPAARDCKGVGLTMIVEPGAPRLAGLVVAGESIDTHVAGDKKAVRALIQAAHDK